MDFFESYCKKAYATCFKLQISSNFSTRKKSCVAVLTIGYLQMNSDMWPMYHS